MEILDRPSSQGKVAEWMERLDRPAWKKFISAIAALGLAFLLALYSNIFAEQGRVGATALCASAALLLSGYVALTLVPYLARRASVEWLRISIDYHLTRQGVAFVVIVFLLAIAGLNTGNNLLYLVVASMLAAILMSGVMSLAVLTGLNLEILLPEHVFARRPVAARVRLENQKRILPSFSVTLTGGSEAKSTKKAAPKSPRKAKTQSRNQSGIAGPLDSGGAGGAVPAGRILSRPLYFPLVSGGRTLTRTVELDFPRRGVYSENGFSLGTRFPFGFLEKQMAVEVSHELVVYPSVEPTDELYEILPMLTGELEAFQRGRGNDLYSIREMLSTDSARHVDWKASARTGSLKVREFAREDERRLHLVLDRRMGPLADGALERFEAAVDFCASLAWHFSEMDAQLQFSCDDFHTPAARSQEAVYDILAFLAIVKPTAETPREPPAMASAENTFRIVFTSAPRGSIPTTTWSRSYYIFLDTLPERSPAGSGQGAAGRVNQ